MEDDIFQYTWDGAEFSCEFEFKVGLNRSGYVFELIECTEVTDNLIGGYSHRELTLADCENLFHWPGMLEEVEAAYEAHIEDVHESSLSSFYGG